jgi:hypothetical protein
MEKHPYNMYYVYEYIVYIKFIIISNDFCNVRMIQFDFKIWWQITHYFIIDYVIVSMSVNYWLLKCNSCNNGDLSFYKIMTTVRKLLTS